MLNRSEKVKDKVEIFTQNNQRVIEVKEHPSEQVKLEISATLDKMKRDYEKIVEEGRLLRKRLLEVSEINGSMRNFFHKLMQHIQEEVDTLVPENKTIQDPIQTEEEDKRLQKLIAEERIIAKFYDRIFDHQTTLHVEN